MCVFMYVCMYVCKYEQHVCMQCMYGAYGDECAVVERRDEHEHEHEHVEVVRPLGKRRVRLPEMYVRTYICMYVCMYLCMWVSSIMYVC